MEKWDKFVNEYDAGPEAALVQKLIDASRAAGAELNAGEASVLAGLQSITREGDKRLKNFLGDLQEPKTGDGVITKEMASKFVALFRKFPGLITKITPVDEIERIVNAWFKE